MMRTPPAWIRVVALGVPLALAQRVCDIVVPQPAPAAAVAAFGYLAAAVAVLAGARRSGAIRRTVWWCFAAAFAGVGLAHLGAGAAGTTGAGLLATASEVLRWGSAAPYLAALIVLIRRRTPGGNRPAVVDTAIIVTALTLVWWIYVIEPASRQSGVGWDTLLRPMAAVLVAAVIVRLALGGGLRSGSYRLIMAALAVTGSAAVLSTVFSTVFSAASLDWLQLPLAVADVLVVAAAWHPSMITVDERAGTPPPPMSVRRLTLLGLATVLPEAVLLVENKGGRYDQVPVISATCALMFILVVAQLYGLIKRQRLLASFDALTGLRTRQYYTDRLRTLAGQGVSMIILDADHFKNINDTYGHPAGDTVLREIANRVRLACRKQDVVARYGGEEFVVLLPRTTPDAAAEVAERIRVAMADAPVTIDEQTQLRVTVSAGVAGLRGDRDSRDSRDPAWETWTADQKGQDGHDRAVEDLLKLADEALYEAKRGGRNRVVTHGLRPEPGRHRAPVAA